MIFQDVLFLERELGYNRSFVETDKQIKKTPDIHRVLRLQARFSNVGDTDSVTACFKKLHKQTILGPLP